MERLLQYLDDLDDLRGFFGLLAEPLRRVVRLAATYMLLACVLLAAVLFKLAWLPLALAAAMMLFTLLLYRSVIAIRLEINR